MPTNTNGGTTTSFMNTPQAKDDLYSIVEDNIWTFDVMANDLGGNAKILWSIDDSNLDGTFGLTSSGDGTYDLIKQDTACVPELSDLGARIWIDSGKIRYDASAFNYLAAGQTVTDHFTYAIRMSNGTLSWATVTVTITGTNDGPTVGAADLVGGVTEDASAPNLTDNGTMSFDDADLSNTHSTSVTAAATNALGGVLTATITDTATGAGDGTVTWVYSVANSATQYLAQGQTATERFTIRISDNSGGYIDQVVVVTITGTNDTPTVTVADLAGAATEDATSPTLTDSGTITFDDVDLTDTHSTAVTPAAGNQLGGVLTASVTDTATGAGDGTVSWSYSVANSAVQYLALGETTTESFTIRISDNNGGTIDQIVVITLTGTNDQPTISAADLIGAATEDATSPTLTDSGTITFDDIDLIDTHSTTVTAAAGNMLGGVLGASVSDTASGAGNGTVTWTYSVANSATQYLALGQTASETFTIRISDNNGGYVDQVVVVTVTGTNDNPTVSFSDLAGAATEDATSPNLTNSGTITFDDLDLTDTHSIGVTPAAGNMLGGSLSASIIDTATGAGDGTVTWNYSVLNANVQYLALGQTTTETFTVRISDNNGGYVDQVVVVTLTGTNDDPTVSVADLVGAATEDASSPTLSDSGLITFDDLDLIDTHSTTVTPAAGNALGGTLTALVTDPASGIGDGAVTWTYSVANAAVQYLALGQTATESFTIRISDNSGGYIDRVVVVTVTGTNDMPTVSAADLAGVVTEDATSPNLADSGTITYDDLDLTDTHSVEVTASAGNTLGGSLTASVTDTASGPGDGTVTWNYSVANSAVQYLALGETETESFTIRIDDNQGGFIDQIVIVTVTGTNDAPTVSVADLAGAVVEDATSPSLSDSGTLTFDDLDLIDTHGATVTPIAGNTLGGTLTASVTDPATGAGDGTVSWTYSVANSATQYLAQGQTATESFTVRISDNNGLYVDRVVVVTVTGTNDIPTVSAADLAGAVTEDGTTPTLTDTGTITFDDLDLIDTQSVDVTAGPGNTLGGSLNATITDVATGVGDGTVTWSYSVTNAATQYLALGESTTETFIIRITDNVGAYVDQAIVVTITGTNDNPTVSLAQVTGGVTEDTASPDLTDSGTITFDDLDLIDAHSTTVTPAAGNLLGGILTASVTDAATGAGDGTVTWTYSVANSAAQYLALGETTSESFTIRISDNYGGFVDQLVVVTITGTNDLPTVSVADLSGAITEDATSPDLAESGAITFDDLDLIDTHATTVTPAAGNLLGGILTASVANAATGAGDGTVTWNYTVANAAVQYLALGQTASETFTIRIGDNNGGYVDQVVTVTVTGTNDDPTVSLTDLSGAASEDASDPTLTDSGTIAFDDLDLTDTHTTTVTADSGNQLGGTLLASVTDPATGIGDGTVTWSYSVANANVQYLALGQTATETFTVRISDTNGGYVDQVVTVTVTGANDGPTVSVADLTGAAIEDGNSPNLTDSGTITFDDLDLIDTHSTMVTAAAGNTLGGTLLASVTDPATGAGDGTVAWSYSVPNANVQYLALGETANETFTIRISDNNGGYVDQLVTVTVTGTNDGPDIRAASGDSASATLPESNGSLMTGGFLTVTDTDTTDTVSTSIALTGVSGNAGGLSNPQLLAMLSVTPNAGLAANAGDTNNLAWNFNSGGEAFNYLAAGQSLQLTYTLTVTDGNGGTDTQAVTVTIQGTNDAPVQTGDLSAAINEGGIYQLTLADLNTTDPDDNGADVTFAASGLSNGTLFVNGLAQNSFTGAQLAAGLVTFLHDGSETTTASFNVSVEDGNEDASVPIAQPFSFTVTPVNDAPVNTVPGGQSVNEDQVRVFSTANGNAISISDADAGTNTVQVTLGVASGTLTLGSIAGILISGGANGSSTVTIEGSQASINNALQGLAYQGNSNFNGADSLSIVTNDLGNVGLGGAQTDSDSIAITVNAVNDAPVNSVPASFTTPEDTNLVLSGLSVSDVDAGSGNVTVTLSVDSGAILMGSSVMVVTSGSGTNTVSITGTVAAVNAFLANPGVQPEFWPTGNANGPVTLTMTTSDNGNAGLGGTLMDTDTRTISIIPVNDSPYVVTEIPPQSFDEDTAVNFQVPAGTFADPENDTLTYSATMWDGSALPGWLTFDASTQTFSGTPPQDYNDGLLISVSASDGQLSATETFNLFIQPVNDKPVNTLPATFTTSDTTPLKLSGLSVSDVDAGAGSITVTLSIASGTLTATNGPGVTVGGSGTGSITLSGQLFWINQYLASAASQPTFNPVSGVGGPVTLTMTTNDNGNSGLGGAQTDSDLSTITVTANQPPVTANDVIWASNNTAVTLSTDVLLGNDIDRDGLALTITSITAPSGGLGGTGLVTVNPNGTFSFTTGAAGGTVAAPTNVTLTYTVIDGAGGSSIGSITLRVVSTTTGVNTIDLTGAGTYQGSFIDGLAGVDNLTDASGLGTLLGGDGADTLAGNTGNDLLIGGDNNDTLSGGDGNDILRGGLGNNDSMDGGNGSEDLLDFSDGTAAVGTLATPFTLVQSSASTSIANGTGNLGNNDSYRNIEGVIGTSLGDFITGSGSNDILRGGGGNDTLNGAGGAGDLIDFRDGTAGITFTLTQSAVGTAFNASGAGLGTDTYSNMEGMIGTNFADTLNGSSGNDTIRGEGGNDIINGGSGNDRIIGGTGADTLTGGIGSDTFVFNSPLNAVDTITDFEASGNDRIELDNDVFLAFGATTGVLAAGNFASNAGGIATDSNDFILFDTVTGNLYYDPDGNGGTQRILIANLTVAAGTIDPPDIFIV